ncbi:hypothetical protein Zmor_013671 [Zophobas morio]|uniref:Uncharacterized protein n=2 Tax=Zophobas morio TaxID=2755281 RepID=A0AA38IGA5_9CUCU|nr:hypothetical protein Zmor_013671 [Zophobas morio]
MKVLVILCLCSVSLALEHEGRYVHDDSGKYVPSNEGQYVPDFSGQYTHDGTGNYKHDGNRYNDDGSGRYKGQFDGLNGNLLPSGTKHRPVVQPVVTIKTTPIKPPTPAPAPRIPLKTYENYQEGKWKILRQLGDIDTDGGYHWEYETENKIIAEESGKVHNEGTDAEAMRAKGFYQYTGPDNVVYAVEYTADENGFNAVGDHLPTPPPVPEDIARALQADRANNKL